MKTKICTKCGKLKSLSAFSKHRLGKDGYAYQCKECNAKRAKEWRKTSSGVYTNIKGRQGFYKTHNDPSAKPFKITRKEFIKWHESQEKECVYCGIREDEIATLVDFLNDKGRRLTVDCKDNAKGYVTDNLVLACHKCNFIKSNIFTHEETLEIGEKYLKPKLEAFRKKHKITNDEKENE